MSLSSENLAHAVSEFRQMRDEGIGSSYLFLQGARIDDVLPSTPTSPDDFPDTPVTDNTLRTVVKSLGNPCAYADEQRGHLFHNIRPIKGEEEKAENTGSVKFEFHTENVHHPFRPDFLILIGLRVDHERKARTRVAEANRAVSLLSDDVVSILSQRRFVSGFPSSFTRTDGVNRVTHPHRVLRLVSGRWYLRFNSHTTQGCDEEAQAAVQRLIVALEEMSEDIELTPGDVVIIDNHTAAHGRTAFTPRYDGQDRWLKRSFAISGAPAWSRWSNSEVFPVIDEIFDSL